MIVNLLILSLFISQIKAASGRECPPNRQVLDSKSTEFIAAPCLIIKEVTLSKDSISLAHFTGSEFINGTWKNINATKINMSQTQLKGTKIEHSDLSHSLFQSAHFMGTRIIRTQMNHSSFFKAKGQYCYFENIDFSESDFRNADLKSCFFINCQFTGIKYNSETQFPQSVINQKDETWNISP